MAVALLPGKLAIDPTELTCGLLNFCNLQIKSCANGPAAGMSRNDASLFDGNIGSWVEMLSTNVLGTCMMTRAVVQVRIFVAAA